MFITIYGILKKIIYKKNYLHKYTCVANNPKVNNLETGVFTLKVSD